MRLSPFSVVIWPTVGEPIAAFGKPKYGVLVRLNASMRTIRFESPKKPKRRVSDTSMFFCPGE